MSKRVKVLLKENNEAEDTLSSESKEVMTDIVVYLRGASISAYQQELVRRDIMDILREAEARKESIRTIIGEEYQVFCDNILAELPVLSLNDRILMTIRDLLPGLMTLLILWAGFGIVDTDLFPYLRLTQGNLVSGILILCASCYLILWISKQSFHKSISKNSNTIILFLVIFVGCIGSNVILSNPLMDLHIGIVVIIMVILFGIYKFMDARLD